MVIRTKTWQIVAVHAVSLLFIIYGIFDTSLFSLIWGATIIGAFWLGTILNSKK